jgi:predicted nucleic acid-binding protein
VKPVVCDASILVAFILPDELSSAADALVAKAQHEQTTLITAAHAALDLGEALNRAQRRGRITAEAWEAALTILEAIRLQYLHLDLSARGAVVAGAQESSLATMRHVFFQRIGGRVANADTDLAATANRFGALWDISSST